MPKPPDGANDESLESAYGLAAGVGGQNPSVSVELTGQVTFPAQVAKIPEGVKGWTLEWRRRGETVRIRTEKWAICLAVTRS